MAVASVIDPIADSYMLLCRSWPCPRSCEKVQTHELVQGTIVVAVPLHEGTTYLATMVVWHLL